MSGRLDGSVAAAPRLAALVSAVLWGTMWIPLRQLDRSGLGGAWATTCGFTLPLFFLLPFGLPRWRRLVAGGAPLAAAGLLMAIGTALYAEGLLRGQVARVILLFYLTPVWGTFLAWLVLDHRITARRVATILLGLAGMLVIFGAGEGLPVPRAIPDWMGLFSGFSWAGALVYIQRTEDVSDFDKMFVQFIFLGFAFFLFTLIPGGRSWTLPTADLVGRSASWLLALALLWMPAVFWLTIFAASRLDPGQVAILLMVEIVVGLSSAAMLTDEPIGAREWLGSLFIVSASGAEFFSLRAEQSQAR
jgi:drug/metabolite transporter (DMT)-like permease